MPVELFPDRGPDGAGAAAVDDADRCEARERRVVDEGANGLSRVLRAPPADVELVAGVAAGGGDDANRRRLRLGGRGSALIRPQALERNAQPVPRGADDLRLVAL